MGNIISFSTPTNDIFVASLILVAYVWFTRCLCVFDRAYDEMLQEKSKDDTTTNPPNHNHNNSDDHNQQRTS
jgi:hypothetical protein